MGRTKYRVCVTLPYVLDLVVILDAQLEGDLTQLLAHQDGILLHGVGKRRQALWGSIDTSLTGGNCTYRCPYATS